MYGYLLEDLPFVVFLAHHDCLKFLRLEELHDIYVAHFEKPFLEEFKHSLHWFVKGMVDKGSDKFFPVDIKNITNSI